MGDQEKGNSVFQIWGWVFIYSDRDSNELTKWNFLIRLSWFQPIQIQFTSTFSTYLDRSRLWSMIRNRQFHHSSRYSCLFFFHFLSAFNSPFCIFPSSDSNYIFVLYIYKSELLLLYAQLYSQNRMKHLKS